MSGKVEGIDAAVRALGRAGELDRSETDAALVKALEPIAAEARRLAPVRTGRLRSSIGVRVGGSAKHPEALVEATVPYAAHVELGTAHDAPQPFLRPALAHGRGKAVTALGKELGRDIERRGKGGR